MKQFKRGKPKLSIIIPSWFTPGQTGKYGENETFWFAGHCLNRLVQCTDRDDYELIIIDNGSTLQEAEALNMETDGEGESDILYTPSAYFAFADILVRNKVNLGFAPACNQGFSLARGEYVVCLNNDILVWPGWVEAVLAPFTAQLTLTPPAGVVMPALMKETRDAREAITIKEIDLSQNFDALGRGAEFGSMWVIPRELLEELKEKDGYYFDENFIVGFGEDRDLWDRVRLLGYDTYRTHKTRVFHQGNMSMSKIKNRREYTEPNREYLKKKRETREKYDAID